MKDRFWWRGAYYGVAAGILLNVVGAAAGVEDIGVGSVIVGALIGESSVGGCAGSQEAFSAAMAAAAGAAAGAAGADETPRGNRLSRTARRVDRHGSARGRMRRDRRRAFLR